MPRPTKQTVDYFPHYVASSKTMFMLERRWGNDGYAFWYKLLELLCTTEGHAYRVNSPLDWEYLTSFMGVDSTVATDILTKLSDIEKIDSELWIKQKTIWCPPLMEHIKFVYDKRSTPMPTKPPVISDKSISDTKTEVSDPKTECKVGFDGVFGVDNPQSKVNKSKVNENDTPSLSPPTVENTAETESETPNKKKAYGSEFEKVRLSDSEYEKLIERLGKDVTEDYIDRLDGWLAEGHRKKSHYATILNWWRRDNPSLAKKGGEKSSERKFKPSRT